VHNASVKAKNIKTQIKKNTRGWRLVCFEITKNKFFVPKFFPLNKGSGESAKKGNFLVRLSSENLGFFQIVFLKKSNHFWIELVNLLISNFLRVLVHITLDYHPLPIHGTVLIGRGAFFPFENDYDFKRVKKSWAEFLIGGSIEGEGGWYHPPNIRPTPQKQSNPDIKTPSGSLKFCPTLHPTRNYGGRTSFWLLATT